MQAAITARQREWEQDNPGQKLSQEIKNTIRATVEAEFVERGIDIQSNNQPISESAAPDAEQQRTSAAKGVEVQPPPVEIKLPQRVETPEEAQKRIDGIHKREVRAVALRTLDQNSNDPDSFTGETMSQLNKYNNLLDLYSDIVKDGPTPYKHKNPDGSYTTYDHVPLNWNSKGPYILPDNGSFLPSDFKIDGSVQIVKVIEKHGQTLTCIDADGKKHTGVPIGILVDAQMHNILRADETVKSLPDRERAVLKAYDTFAQTGKDDEIAELYKDMTFLTETAKQHGFITADAMNAYLEYMYPEIKMKDGVALTAEQEAQNERMHQRKAALKNIFTLDSRAVVDGEVLAGVVSQTSADTLNNLTKALSGAKSDTERQQLQEAINLINDNKERLPQLIETAMSKALPPDLAEGLNTDLRTGNIAGVYDKLLKQFPDKQDEINDLRSKLGEQALKIGGIGIIAIIAALAFGVSSQMGRQR